MTNDDRDTLLMNLSVSQGVANERLKEIKEDLKEHMARTAQNEVLIRMVEEKQSKDIAYVRKHIYWVQGAIALLGLAATVLGIISKLNP